LQPILLIATAFVAFGCSPNIRSKVSSTANALSNAPSVLSIVPPIGPPTGGTNVTISGNNFSNGATVSVAGQPCTSVVVISPTEITCTTPSHDPGAVSVVVTDPTTSQSGTLAFTYYTAAASVPGFAVNLGGGISVTGGLILRSAIGEPALPTTQVGVDGGNGVTAKSGIVNLTSLAN